MLPLLDALFYWVYPRRNSPENLVRKLRSAHQLPFSGVPCQKQLAPKLVAFVFSLAWVCRLCVLAELYNSVYAPMLSSRQTNLRNFL